MNLQWKLVPSLAVACNGLTHGGSPPTQGDIWDALKDMTSAVVGGILATATLGVAGRWRR